MAAKDVLRQFLEEPGGHAVMDTSLKILDVGPEFVRSTKTRREDLIGKEFINILTEPNQERHMAVVDSIRTGAAIAVKTRQPYNLKVHRSDIISGETGSAEERWWRSTITPIEDQTGEIRFLVLRMEDVTATERTARLLLVQRRLLYVLCAVVIAAIVAAAIALSDNINHTDRVARITCEVQKEGIVGNHLLGNIMSDISGIITNSPAPQKRQVTKGEIRYGLALEHALTLYLNVVRHLPTHRNCD